MMAKLIPILLVCVLGSVWGYLEEDNWTNYQSLASYQSPKSWTWPWQGVKKGMLSRQGILSNLSPAQLAFLALVSSLSLKINRFLKPLSPLFNYIIYLQTPL